MTTTTAARRRFFAIRANIAKRRAAAEAANETSAVTEAPRTAPTRTNKGTAPRRNVKETTGASAPASTSKNSLPPTKAIDGTLSDIKRVKGANGYFTRALFRIKDGDEFTGVSALISDQAKKALGKNLKDGSVRLYGVLHGDTFRVLGLGYTERSAKAAPRQPQVAKKEVDYSFQHDAIFNAAT
jgi:hypothetical protein